MKQIFITISFAIILVSCGTQPKQEQQITELAGALDEIDENTGIKIRGVENGQTVKSPLNLSIKNKGIEITTPGEAEKGKGHYHILVNQGFVKKGLKMHEESVKSIHLHNGESDFKLDLPPGKTVITAQLVDGDERSYGIKLSDDVKFIVQE